MEFEELERIGTLYLRLLLFLQISGSLEDYVLLEKLNKMTVTKYSEMSNTAKTLITAMEELDKKCKLTVWTLCVRFVHAGNHSCNKRDQILSSCIVHKKLLNMHWACISLMVHRLIVPSCYLYWTLPMPSSSLLQTMYHWYIIWGKTMVLKREIMNNNKLGYFNL